MTGKHAKCFRPGLILAQTLCFLVLTCATVLAGPATGPTDRVKQGADELIRILKGPHFQNPAQHDEAIAILREAAEKYIDFEEVTKLTVGRKWLDMPEAQHKEITEAFIKLLERTYLKRIPTYNNEKVNYKKELLKGNRAMVLTEIVSGDKTISVNFRLKVIGNQWMIYDVVAEGVSLVKNYRSQFAQILQDGTPDDLIARIRDRVKELDAKGDDETDKL